MSSIFYLPVCPHCNMRRVAFYLKGEYQVAHNKFFALWKCGQCEYPVCTEARVSAAGGYLHQSAIIKIFPESNLFSAPDGTPKHIEDAFIAAKFNVIEDRPSMWEAAAIMVRKSIELAVKEFGADNGNLKHRIDDLVKKGILTHAMGTWAHEIRLIGNEGAHGTDITQEDAKQAIYFAEMLFIYLYKLPKMVEERRSRNCS